MTSEPNLRLLDPLFATEAMREVFSDGRTLQGMLDFELALARSFVETAQAPAAILPAIKNACRADLYDANALAHEAALAGNLAIPLVKALTARVEKQSAAAAAFVHLGATSHDAIDTGRVLQVRDALALLDAQLAKISETLAALVKKYAAAEIVGRTWLQQASPTTLGFKFAGWLDAVERHRDRFASIRPRALALQFGGSVGTLAVLEPSGPKIRAALARRLGLVEPEIAWHAHRDRFAEVAALVGLVVGTAGKIARDISLLSQTEVAEVFEPTAPGRGGSSAMPQKQNPVGCAVILSAATRVPPLVATMLSAMVQEHERGLGGWHAEWETLPDIFLLASGALAQLVTVLGGLDVNMAGMTGNFSARNGLVMTEAFAVALSKHESRAFAQKVAKALARVASETNQPLRDVVLKDPQMRKFFKPAEIDRIFDPKNFTGSAELACRKVLAARVSKIKQRKS